MWTWNFAKSLLAWSDTAGNLTREWETVMLQFLLPLHMFQMTGCLLGWQMSQTSCTRRCILETCCYSQTQGCSVSSVSYFKEGCFNSGTQCCYFRCSTLWSKDAKYDRSFWLLFRCWAAYATAGLLIEGLFKQPSSAQHMRRIHLWWGCEIILKKLSAHHLSLMPTSSAEVHSYLVIPTCVSDHKAFTGCGFCVINDGLLLQLMEMWLFLEHFFQEPALFTLLNAIMLLNAITTSSIDKYFIFEFFVVSFYLPNVDMNWIFSNDKMPSVRVTVMSVNICALTAHLVFDSLLGSFDFPQLD